MEEKPEGYTMDRVGPRLTEIETRWRELLTRLAAAVKEVTAVTDEMDLLRQDYANLVTPAHRKNWRYKAMANGLPVPPEDVAAAETDDPPAED